MGSGQLQHVSIVRYSTSVYLPTAYCYVQHCKKLSSGHFVRQHLPYGSHKELFQTICTHSVIVFFVCTHCNCIMEFLAFNYKTVTYYLII